MGDNEIQRDEDCTSICLFSVIGAALYKITVFMQHQKARTKIQTGAWSLLNVCALLPVVMFAADCTNAQYV
jgi:hypothetical protein